MSNHFHIQEVPPLTRKSLTQSSNYAVSHNPHNVGTLISLWINLLNLMALLILALIESATLLSRNCLKFEYNPHGGMQWLRGHNFALFWPPPTSMWTFLTLNVDKKRDFLDHLPPLFVHVVIECPPFEMDTFAINGFNQIFWQICQIWS